MVDHPTHDHRTKALQYLDEAAGQRRPTTHEAPQTLAHMAATHALLHLADEVSDLVAYLRDERG